MNIPTNARLTFLTDQAQLVRLSVRRARLNLTDQVVDTAMDNIILANAYDTRGRGRLMAKYSAELVTTDSITFDVA